MCAKAVRNFKCAGFAVTDGSVAGAAVLRFGGHASHCEPIASIADADSIGQDVAAKACGVGGAPPTCAVSLCLAKSPPAIANSTPHGADQAVFGESIVQSTAKGRGRRGERSFAELLAASGAFYSPPKFPRRAKGANFLLRNIGPGGGRILMIGCERNIRSLSHADV